MESSKFNVIVAGSRDFNDFELLTQKLDQLFANRKPTRILSGAARGADTLAIEYAKLRDIPCRKFPAQWRRWGRRAGMIRNREMLEHADALVAFWDGESRGTKHMIDIATEAEIEIRIIRI